MQPHSFFHFPIKNEYMNKLIKTTTVYFHGAHTREEQGHADEDINSNNSL